MSQVGKILIILLVILVVSLLDPVLLCSGVVFVLMAYLIWDMITEEE